MIHPSRALAALAGAAALTLTGLAPATAAVWTHDDAVGDVQSQTETLDPATGDWQEGEPVLAPDNTDTDVTRVSVDHRPHRVVLETTLRDVSLSSGFLVYDIRTGDRRYTAMQRLGNDKTFPAFTLVRGNDSRVRCAGAQHDVDRAGDRVTLNLPRRCLGGPRWVRVGIGAAKLDQSVQDTYTTTADDALRDAVIKDDLALSPRVRRG